MDGSLRGSANGDVSIMLRMFGALQTIALRAGWRVPAKQSIREIDLMTVHTMVWNREG